MRTLMEPEFRFVAERPDQIEVAGYFGNDIIQRVRPSATLGERWFAEIQSSHLRISFAGNDCGGLSPCTICCRKMAAGCLYNCPTGARTEGADCDVHASFSINSNRAATSSNSPIFGRFARDFHSIRSVKYLPWHDEPGAIPRVRVGVSEASVECAALEQRSCKSPCLRSPSSL